MGQLLQYLVCQLFQHLNSNTKKVYPVHRFLAESHFWGTTGESYDELESEPNHVDGFYDDKGGELVHDFVFVILKIWHSVQSEDDGGEENTAHRDYTNNSGSDGGMRVLKEIPNKSL